MDKDEKHHRYNDRFSHYHKQRRRGLERAATEKLYPEHLQKKKNK